MNTITYRAPRLSRAKAMIGALLATLAIAVGTQATTPDSASAQAACPGILAEGHRLEAEGHQEAADFWYGVWQICVGLA
jgi:hypothetical protein